ncbi:conserved exported hypothetical protein [Candidatus Zixiibacteriota bacterium]|nr:conserved exported hypothetical protein [candidate division Zixibacteria bacterium]
MKKLLRTKTLAVLLLAVISLGGSLALGQGTETLDNKGREFILTFLPNYTSGSTELHLTSDVATDVTIEWPMNAPTFTTTVAVNPGAITAVTIPTGAEYNWNTGGVAGNAIHATAAQEFVCYLINRASATSDAALGLPVDVMNTDYMVVTNRGSTAHSGDAGLFVVVARTDNTQVTITPSHNLYGGYAAGVPFNIVLNRGQGFLGQSLAHSDVAADLTGTQIVADKPVGMTNGNFCTNVPPNVYACDHIFEVAQPVQSWGKRIFVPNLPLRTGGSIYKILAAEDNTTVTQDGAPLGVLNKGQYIETDYLPGYHVFEGDKAIFVVQFMPSQDSPNAIMGDPAMANMSPAEQYLWDYTFSTVGGAQFARNFLSVIAHNTDITGGTMTLDGAPIPAASFNPIAGTDLSAAVIELAEGTHSTASIHYPHGITVEGYNSYDSYSYPGGAMFIPINPIHDTIPPICEQTSNNGCVATATATDIHDNASGIFLVRLDHGSVNLALTVTPFEQGASSASYSVTTIDNNLPGNGTVTVIDGEGNTCALTYELNCGGPIETGSIFGKVLASGSGLQGVRIDLYTSGDMFIGSTYTDNGGDYSFADVINGDYSVRMQVPLGFAPVTPETVAATVAGNQVEVNFELTSSATGKVKNIWWWKAQLAYIRDGARSEITRADIDNYGQAIFDHFYMRGDAYAIQIENVTFAAGPRPLNYDDILAMFLGPYDGATQVCAAHALLTNLLNVAAGRQGQLAVVSYDGATASQAITYFAGLYQAGGAANYYSVHINMRRMHMMQKIPAGIIPLGTANIMFKPESEISTLPEEFVLSQNSPNPFNPSTEIGFYLPSGAKVSLEVFNISGQKVTVLVDDYLPAGGHSVIWDGTDIRGQKVASGIYFYRLNAGSFADTKKMMLLK